MSTSRAVLAAVWLPGIDEAVQAAGLVEMERLAGTLGIQVVGRVVQRLPGLARATVLGGGKLRALAALTGGSGEVPSGVERTPSKARRRQEAAEDEAEEAPAPMGGEAPADGETLDPDGPAPDMVIVNNEISPSQIRNLEAALGVPVMDRTGVIIEIFYRHARTREARLQVELARLAYEAPRLRSRPRGAGRGRVSGPGGPGESELELDRRRVRDRMAEVRQELASVAGEESARRGRQLGESKVALVGYTNAGKSSLMRALTGSEVLVADQLFATLGTTVRALAGGRGPRILVSDTVGFIQDLPHDLVASFRSTLEEVSSAGLLLFVLDAADPDHLRHLEVTTRVVDEVGAADRPRRIVLNKADRLDADAVRAARQAFPEAFLMSTTRPDDVVELAGWVRAFFAAGWPTTHLHVPYTAQRVVELAHTTTLVLDERYDADGAWLRLQGPAEALEQLRRALGAAAPAAAR